MQVARDICCRDPRYHIDSYSFIREALEFTAKRLDKAVDEDQARHVSGRELLDGVRNYAIEEFGPMALTVLRSWNITRTEHLGDLVFNLVDAGVLRKTETDTRADFADGFDFEDAFVQPFLPSTSTQA